MPCLEAILYASRIADIWATPTPAIIRVVQMDPGPTPTLTASTPAAMRALAPSDVATLPAINSHLGKLDFVDFMALMTPAECPCDVSIEITSAPADSKAAMRGSRSMIPTAAPTRNLPLESLQALG